MPELFKPTFKDKRTGQTRTTRWYYTRIQGRRVSLGTADKTVALRKAVELERQAEYGHDPGHTKYRRFLTMSGNDSWEGVSCNGYR